MAAPRGRVLFFGGLPKGTTHIAVPLQRPALQGGPGPRLLRVAPPRPGGGARHAGRRRRRHPLRGLGHHRRSTRRPTRSRGSAPARRSRSSSRRDHARRSLRHSLAQELRGADPGGRVAAGRADAVGARAGAASTRLALVDARRRSRCSRRRATSPPARLGHLRHAPAGAAATTSGATSASPSLIASTGLEPGTVEESCAARSPRRAAVAEALGVAEGEPRERAAARAHGGRPARRRRHRLVPGRAPRARGPAATVGSIYAALAERGLAVDHGVAHLTPRNADGEVAERLGVAERDAAADDRPGRPRRPTASPCSSRASTTSPTRSPSRCCGAGPATRRGGALSAPLVVGVDVGSQGTCAQALEPDGTLVATSLRAARAVAIRAPGWAEQDPRGVDSRARSHAARGARRRPRGARSSALSFGSQLDGLVAADADGEPLRPALIWATGARARSATAVAARVGRRRGCAS